MLSYLFGRHLNQAKNLNSPFCQAQNSVFFKLGEIYNVQVSSENSLMATFLKISSSKLAPIIFGISSKCMPKDLLKT